MWLTRVPQALVRACLEMLPRIQAEESLQMARRVAVGSGTLTAEDAKAAQSDWLRTCEPVRRPKVRHKATPADLAAMGISYRVVPSSG